jgi:hypothetical protein
MVYIAYMEDLRKIVSELNDFYGNWVEIIEKDNIFPFISENVLLKYIRGFLYKYELIVSFNWVNWEAGKVFLENKDYEKYENIDKDFIIKLLSTIIRHDRFCDGAWASLFKSGEGRNLFKRLLAVEENEKRDGGKYEYKN